MYSQTISLINAHGVKFKNHMKDAQLGKNLNNYQQYVPYTYVKRPTIQDVDRSKIRQIEEQVYLDAVKIEEIPKVCIKQKQVEYPEQSLKKLPSFIQTKFRSKQIKVSQPQEQTKIFNSRQIQFAETYTPSKQNKYLRKYVEYQPIMEDIDLEYSNNGYIVDQILQKHTSDNYLIDE
ncbi:hypothetical protein SS50377_27485 [Spironucleus salmonicida]|uniref:Uncharacterized protein n=1 Tax=Spironucleus salmonicida TaxID=348837 RepID=V6LTA1_9EUKA|nr:hypothetical protein SS50377_27485 [Spironucleus salmonicida]|eukprot:EST46921.1 Hypothetical protein SS50377_13077 [Spironucleus salmonicida]